MRPKRIKIGPYHFEVNFRKKGTAPGKNKENVGETHFQLLEIWVKKNKHEMEAETLMHETLHAIFATSGISGRFSFKQEEELVSSLTPWLMATLLDNPELVEYLMKEANEL